MSTSAASSLRVLALITDGFGGYGGIAEYNRQLLSALKQCKSIGEVIAVPRLNPGSLQPLPPGLRQLRPVKGKITYSAFALRTAIAKPVNIVFCGHLAMAPLAAAIAKLVRAPLWVQVHGIEAWEELSWLHRQSIEAASLVTSVSRYTRRRLLAWVNIDPARVRVLPNTVDGRFQAAPKSNVLLDKYGLRDKQVLLTVSRLSSSERYKGHDRIIRILPRVLAKHPGTKYLIVGDGDDRARLEVLATEVGVRDRVHFAGLIDPADLPRHYCLADVFVMPSTGEGFGIAFLEAMASGVRVVGGDRDGSCDPLADGMLGTTIDPENEDELAAAICAALSASRTETHDYTRFGICAFATHLQSILGSTVACAQPGTVS